MMQFGYGARVKTNPATDYSDAEGDAIRRSPLVVAPAHASDLVRRSPLAAINQNPGVPGQWDAYLANKKFLPDGRLVDRDALGAFFATRSGRLAWQLLAIGGLGGPLVGAALSPPGARMGGAMRGLLVGAWAATMGLTVAELAKATP